MKRIILAGLAAALMTSAAAAETIGFSMQRFDDNFLAILRGGLEARAEELGNVELLVEDAQGDIARQQSQIENFIAAGVDGMIIIPVDADASVAMSKTAEAAGIPMVFTNNQPSNLDELPSNQAFVGSDQIEAGSIGAREVCKRLNGQGKAVVLMGELGTLVARGRTEAVHQVFNSDECSGIEIVEEQSATWSRTQALDLVTNWLSAGLEFDAVLANNDEMALGAIQALKASRRSMDDYVVAGIDATQDALVSMKNGELDVTVFQDATAQGSVSLDTVLKLARGKETEQKVFPPLDLVTADNMNDYLDRN